MNSLLENFQNSISITPDEGVLIENAFTRVFYSKGTLFLEEGKVCRKVAWIQNGAFIYKLNKDGEEQVCDFAFENAWITQLKSLTTGTPSGMSIQAVEDSYIYETDQEKLQELSSRLPKVHEFMSRVSQSAFIEIAQRMVEFSTHSAEERYAQLLKTNPGLFQRVPLSYIASYLGVTQRHLSRIRGSIR